MFADIKHAVRLFLSSRSSAPVAVAVVGAALGLASAVLGISAVWLQPSSGWRDPATLFRVSIERVTPDSSRNDRYWRYQDFTAVRRLAPELQLGAFAIGLRALETADGTRRSDLRTAFVTSEFFRLTGARSIVGRLLEPGDAEGDAVVISDGLWSRHFGRSSSVIGRSVSIGERTCIVVGVLEASFTGPTPTQPPALWLPIEQLIERSNEPDTLGGIFPTVLARLQNAADKDRLRAAIRGAIGSELGVRAEIGPVDAAVRVDATELGVAIQYLVGALTGVAALSLAVFLLVSSSARSTEMSARFALGASPGRIARQLLAESALLASASVVVAVLMAHWLAVFLAWYVDLPLGPSYGLTLQSITFIIVAGPLVAVIAGVASMRLALGGWQGWRAVQRTGRQWGSASIIAFEVAGSVTAVVCAITLARGASETREADLGADLRQLLTVSGRALGLDAASAPGYWSRAVEATRGVGGIEQVAFARYAFGGGWSAMRLMSAGRTYPPAAVNRVSHAYFSTMGTTFLAGRPFASELGEADGASAIVSVSVARDRFKSPQEAIGASLALGTSRESLTIVGVVEDAVTRTLLDLAGPRRAVYLPLGSSDFAEAFMLVRFSSEPEATAAAVQRVLPTHSVDRPPRVSRVARDLDSQLLALAMPHRVARVTAFSVVLFTVAGLQGLVALAVRQRLRDIGVRIALGASRTRIVQWVITLHGPAIASGLAFGALGAYLVATTLSALSAGLSPADPLTVILACLTMLLALAVGLARPTYLALRAEPAKLMRD